MVLTNINENAHVLNTGKKIILFSYGTPVAMRDTDRIGDQYFMSEEKHSPTTTKHIKEWLINLTGSDKCKVVTQSFFEGLL